MMSTAESIRASHLACRRLSRNARSNFPATFVLLSPDKRKAMYALYAFMRHSDDLADSPAATVDAAIALRNWRQALVASLDNKQSNAPSATTALQSDAVGAAILPAVCETIRGFGIPIEHLHAVIDGVEMDLAPRSYETFADLETYCRRVATAVGMSCIYVWGFRGPEAFVPSHSAGMALQLTNILRDLKEDAAAGRVYLPLDDIESCGYSLDQLRAGVVNASFLNLLELEAFRAEGYYRQAEALLPCLHRDGQRIYGLMMATYRALLRKIRRRPAEVFAGRVRLNNAHKLWIAARWACLPIGLAGRIEKAMAKG